MIKNLPASAGNLRDTCSITGLGRFPRGGHGNPLQFSCLENPMNRGAWCATTHMVIKSWMWLRWINMHTVVYAPIFSVRNKAYNLKSIKEKLSSHTNITASFCSEFCLPRHLIPLRDSNTSLCIRFKGLKNLRNFACNYRWVCIDECFIVCDIFHDFHPILKNIHNIKRSKITTLKWPQVWVISSLGLKLNCFAVPE